MPETALPVLQAPARPVKLAHVVLRTTRLTEMAEWYKEVLGARVVFESPMAIGVTFDEEHHRLAFIAVPFDAPAPEVDAVAAQNMVSSDVDLNGLGFRAFSGLEHIAFTFGDLPQLLS